MKVKIMAAAMMSCFLLTSCATMRAGSDSIADALGTDKGTTETATGAVAGAAAGGLIGQLLGRSTTATVIGMLTGGLVGGILGHQDAKDRGLFEAEKLAETIRTDVGVKAKIQSEVREESIADESGNLKKNVLVSTTTDTTSTIGYKPNEVRNIAYFKGLAYDLPESSLASKSATLAETLEKTGRFAASRQTPVQVIIQTTHPGDSKWCASQVKKGFPKKGAPRLVIQKAQTGKPSQIQVIDAAQRAA